MSQSRKTPRSANVAPLYAAQPQRTPARRRAGALLMGTALSAVIGLGYGRGAYAQALSTSNETTVELTGPGDFVTTDGFSVDTTGTGSGGNAITITTASGATGDTTFTDNHASTIKGAEVGVDADNDGNGALSIITTGTVSGYGTTARDVEVFEDAGVRAINRSNGSGIKIDVNEVYGAYNGVYALNYGSEQINIDAQNVTSDANNAIVAKSYGSGSGIRITTTGLIEGGHKGIYAEIDDNGPLTITAQGDVRGAFHAIQADNDAGDGGDTTITTYGDVIGDTNSSDAADNGIVARNRNEAGALRITTHGRVEGNRAIEARQDADELLRIEANGDLVGTSTDGMRGRHRGDGDLVIMTGGTVTGNSSAADDGIEAEHRGDGDLSVTANGDVFGSKVHDSCCGGFVLTGVGIDVEHEGNGTAAIFASGDVIGGRGIEAEHDGKGALSIIATGDVEGAREGNEGTPFEGLYGEGIFATTAGGEGASGTTDLNGNSLEGVSLAISANNVTGGTTGIYASNYGSGALSISTTGTVTGTGAYYHGIYARNSANGTGLTIAANNVTGGGYHGIYADNDGTGALSITTTGTVAGATGNGINARNSANGTGLTIAANNVTGGGYHGIDANNQGSGALSITTTGTVTGITTGYHGILASNRFGVGGADDTDVNGNSLAGVGLAITANTVTGGDRGITAVNFAGALSITTTGTVTGNGADGIYAYNSANGEALTVIANIVEGSDRGVRSKNYANDDQRIEIRGNVEAADEGVFSSQFGNGDVIIITEGDVNSDRERAIRGNHQATGNLRVTASGNLTTPEDAIRADHNGDGDVYVEFTGNRIDAGDDGIDADLNGVGSITVITHGTIEAGGSSDNFPGFGPFTDNGIKAVHRGTGDLNILSTERVSGARGIAAEHDGDGAINITATGDVEGTGTPYGEGIYAKASGVGGANAEDLDGNSLEGVSLTITANTVTGATTGIYADNDGSGALSITANGAVTGGTGDGIYANNASTEDLTITINEGGSVSTSGTDTANDFAIEAIANNGAVIVDNFGTVTGRVNLTNSNTFTNAGTWDLAGTTSNFNATGHSLVVNEGLIIAASDGAADEISAIDNLDTFRSNAGGTIRLADGGAGDVLRIDADAAGVDGAGTGNFVANGGTVALDVVLGGDGSAADRLDISGDVVLDGAPTALAINSVGGGAGGETTTGIEVVTVGGTSDAGAFVLAGPMEVGALSYDLSLGQCDDTANDNWYLCNTGTIGTTGAVFEAMPGVVLNSFARTETLQQRLGARVQGGTGPTLSTRGEADLPVAQSVGPWMRTWGDFADITPDSSSAGTSWEADSWGLEAGIGTILGDHAGGNLVGGVNLRYGATYADLSNPVGTASLNAEGFGMAASLTWFGNDGFYVDGNAAVDFVSIDATSQGGGELLNDHDDVVYSASAQVGKRIELQGGTTLVPQAQLSWGRMRDGSLTDNLGNVVSFADRETLTSRVGLTVEQDVTGSSWGAGKVFGFVNVLHDLEGSRTATVAGTDVTQSGTGDWLELGGGFSLQPTENSNVFGQVSYLEAFNGVDGDAIAVSAGWRMQW